jgi:hypothetical protein
MTFWLQRYRKLDMTQEKHRHVLVDTFVNAVFVHDDKLLLTFNFKDGTRTITLKDTKIATKKQNGSNLDCSLAPKKKHPLWGASFLVSGPGRTNQMRRGRASLAARKDGGNTLIESSPATQRGQVQSSALKRSLLQNFHFAAGPFSLESAQGCGDCQIAFIE